MFTKGFGKFVGDGDRITCEVDGFHVMADVHHDPDMGEPWKEHDGHGVVSEWVSRAKAPGERILITDHKCHRFYDIAASIEIAKRDGWDCEPYNTGSKGERAARAVERDFKVLKAWCNDEWMWCGVTVNVSRNGVRLTGDWDHALWGIECNYPDSDNAYLMEVANELLGDALDAARTKLGDLCLCDADEDERRC
jgi:hypothetical protein